jgi:hypothetical protein
VNNIQLRLRGLSRNISWDSTSKGKSTLIFSCPVFSNTQGYGETNSTMAPDGVAAANRPRFNTDNNGRLFINTSPDTLYNFDIDDSFLKTGTISVRVKVQIVSSKKEIKAALNIFDSGSVSLV